MHTGKLTKIVATIGPASESPELVRDLISAGVNVFRFNTKHNTNEWHKQHIHLVQHVSREMGVTMGILVDLQGPEIRIDTFEGAPIEVHKNDLVIFSDDFYVSQNVLDVYPQHKIVRIAQSEVFKALTRGDKFSIDDGFIDFEVFESHKNFLVAKAQEDAVIKNRKGLNLVGKDVDLPSLTASDKERIEMASETKADFIALSFVRSASDIDTLRAEMKKHHCFSKIIAKIESQKGVDNIDEIIEAADGIMVARGDLGIEVPIERVTYLQKDMIKRCRNANKPVIVATQMLQSMVDNARPTRAEAADVANAIYDETDAIMLSGETASGKYPVKAVEVMRKIAKFNESHKEPSTFKPVLTTQSHLLVDAAMSILSGHGVLKVDKMIVFTETGSTARILSSFRPKIPVIAISESKETCEALTLSYGVVAFKIKIPEREYGYPEEVINALKEVGLLETGNTVLIVHGKKFKQSGSTNALVMLQI